MINHTKRTFLKVTLLVSGTILMTAGGFFEIRPERYRATTRIKPAAEKAGQQALAYAPPYVQTEFEVIQSEKILDAVIAKLDLNKVWAGKAEISGKISKTAKSRILLRRKLEIRPTLDPGLIDISIISDDKNEATKLANTIAQVYRDFRLTQWQAFESEVETNQRIQLEKLARQQEAYREKRDDILEQLINLAPGIARSNMPTRPIHIIHREISPDRDYLKQKELLERLRKLSPEQLCDNLPTSAPDHILSQLLQDRNVARTQLDNLKQTRSESDPELQFTVRFLAKVNADIKNRVQGILKSIEIQVNSKEALVQAENKRKEAEQQEQIALLNEKASVERGLRESTLASATLQSKFEQENADAKNQTREAVEIIRPAMPPSTPLFPSHHLALGMLALGLGMEYSGLLLFNARARRKIRLP